MQKEAIMEYLIIDGQAKKVEECDIFNKIQNSPIYEVVRIIDGKEQFIKDHIQRMFASFELLGYGNEYDEDEIINDVSRYPESIGERASKEFFEINGTNAIFMKEEKL